MKRIAGGLVLLLSAVALPIDVASAADGYRLLNLDGHDVKWGEPVPGAGATITYAVAESAPREMGTRNCTNVSAVDPLLKHTALSQQKFMAALQDALDMWEQVADVRFVAANNKADADVLIAAETVPDGIAYTDLTIKTIDQDAPAVITHGIVCLNPQLTWQAGPAEAKGSYNLTAVLAHEIGHILGLDHPGPHGEMMSFEYDPGTNRLQSGDIAGVEYLYGNRKPIMSAAITAHIATP